jgi:serine/threonine protein kinase
LVNGGAEQGSGAGGAPRDSAGSGVVHPQRFLAGIIKSRLMDRNELKAALQGVPGFLHDNTKGLSDHLVQHGVLTRFQAGKLMMGVTRGLRLGPYMLLSPIARGGMATVYLARSAEDPRLLVAVKVLPPAMALQPRHLARFVRECDLLADAPRHPNLCGFVSKGEDSGVHYLAMDFVPGQSLYRRIAERGPLEPSEAARVGAEVSRALGALHAAGIVHRDIKPSNILISPSGKAFVIDLGLAYRAGEVGQPVDVVGGPGYIVGSMDFIAPEQTIDSSRVDGRADLYSLGCTLYFALAGKPPYPSAGTSKERMAAHRKLPVPSVREAVPEVSERFSQLIRSLMEKDPRSRFGSPAVLAADLQLLAANPRDLFPEGPDGDGIRLVLDELGLHSPSGRTAVEELVLGEEQAEEAPELIPPQFLPADWVTTETASTPPGPPALPQVPMVSPQPAPPAAPAWEMWVLGALVAVCLFLVVAIGLLLAGVF